MKKTDIDPGLFWPTLILLVAVSAFLVLFPEAGETAVNAAFAFTTGKFSWLFLLGTMAVFGFLLWLVFSKYGSIKLGKPDDKPDFSTFSWIAMIFTAGIGSGLLYWGTIEWSYYISGPPFGFEPYSKEAFEFSNAYNLFHWGLSAWALYCLPAIPIAYAYYIKKVPVIRMSVACRGLLGKYADGFFGKVIDVLTLFGLLGGMGAALGLGTPMVTAGISYLTGIPEGFSMQVVVVLIWTAIFATSVYMGLEKGIKVLSDWNLYLAIAIIAFVFAVGPTTFILDSFTNGLGIMFQNFIQMSMFTDWYSKSGFPQGWTVFYWAWWIALGPFVGLWATRISKGRTIRELIIAMVVWGSAGCWLFHGVLGNYALSLQVNGIIDVVKITAEQGAPAAIVAVITSLPLGNLVLAVFIAAAFIFLATSLDSSAYTLAMVCTKDVKENEDPARWHRFVWALALAALPVSMMFLGGLRTMQTACVVTGLPLTFVFIFMAVSLYRWIQEDYGNKGCSSLKKAQAVISSESETNCNR